ncbi:protein of unknown function [Burkholderia multivorans]
MYTATLEFFSRRHATNEGPGDVSTSPDFDRSTRVVDVTSRLSATRDFCDPIAISGMQDCECHENGSYSEHLIRKGSQTIRSAFFCVFLKHDGHRLRTASVQFLRRGSMRC